MAKVKNPALSLAASGTIGNVISYRMSGGRAEVTIKPHAKNQTSPQQLIEQERMKQARATYKALSAADKTSWQQWAAHKQISTWAAYYQEYQLQRVTAGNNPLIPEPNI